MTTTAMAQSGIPPTSSSAMEGACSSLATTEKKRKNSWKQKFLLDRLTRSSSHFQSWNSTTHTHILCLVENLVIICSMYKILLYRHKYIKSRETLRSSTFPICITKIGKQTMGSHLKCIHTTFRIYTLCIYTYIFIFQVLHFIYMLIFLIHEFHFILVIIFLCEPRKKIYLF